MRSSCFAERRGATRSFILLALALALLSSPAIGADRERTFAVVDLHVDLPWQVHYKKRPPSLDRGHTTRKALLSGHVKGLVLPLYIPGKVRPSGPAPGDLEEVFSTIEKLVFSPLLPLGAEGRWDKPRVRSWLAIEGAQALASDPQAITQWVQRGVRLVGLAHTSDNELAGSSTGKLRGGFTDRGKQLAKAALDAGALLDVSHLSDAAFEDARQLSEQHSAPLVASHSDARAVCNHPRNLTDAQLRAIASSGGVAGLNLHAPYLSSSPNPTMVEVIAQLDHMVKIAGEDHVAIGSDFDGGITPPADISTPMAFPDLARALQRHGWSDARIEKVFSANALRVLGWTRPEGPR